MDNDNAEGESKNVKLLEERGATSRFIHARIEANGNLVVLGHDVGASPKKFFDSSDYEFIVTVRTEDKDRVLLALIEKVYGGRFSAVDEFRKFLQEKKIKFGWMIW
jgi:hypothetical protein